MNIAELMAELEKYPPEMLVIVDHFSDYQIANLSIIDAVPKGHYIMRAHPTMSQENKNGKLEFLLIST